MNNWIAREKALFCINCEVIFEASRCCPRCQSKLFLPLSKFQGLQAQDQDQDHQSDPVSIHKERHGELKEQLAEWL